jgi:riboflavin synthase
MFTGIVEEVGDVLRRTPKLLVKSSLEGERGESIAVNGACLTLLSRSLGVLEFEVSEETLGRTNLSSARHVNLERAMRLGSRLSGNFVLGHVDAVSEIVKMGRDKIEVKIPKGYGKYIVEKGSVAVNGMSLTVADVLKSSFSVAILPFTLENTNLKFREKYVNLEFDYLAKLIGSLVSENKNGNGENRELERWKANAAVM